MLKWWLSLIVLSGWHAATVSAGGVGEHIVTPETVLVEFRELQISDSGAGRKSVLHTVIENRLGVEIVLRYVASDAGEIAMQKRYRLFGLESWNSKDFIAISPGERFVFDSERWRLLLDPEIDPAADIHLYFNFGPKGHIDFSVSLPELLRAAPTLEGRSDHAVSQ